MIIRRGWAGVCAPALLMALFATGAHASALLYTFGGDFLSPGATGVPDSLSSMDPASAASIANVQTPVGNGNTGFTGGLVFANGLLYGVGNDSNGVATLYSLQTDGLGLTAVSSDFNTSGGAAGVTFQNGLTAAAAAFFAIGASATGEDLYRIDTNTATLIQGLQTFGGTYTGLVWDSSGLFYAVLAGANGGGLNGDYLVRFGIGSPVNVVANLTALDGAPVGTHLGGLADAGGGVFYDIYTNPATFTGELERITAGGITSAATLYDTQIPLAQNAGVAIVPTTATPEPATGLEIGAGLLLVGWILKRRKRNEDVKMEESLSARECSGRREGHADSVRDNGDQTYCDLLTGSVSIRFFPGSRRLPPGCRGNVGTLLSGSLQRPVSGYMTGPPSS